MIHVDILKSELTDELVPIEFSIEFTMPEWAKGKLTEQEKSRKDPPLSHPLYFTKKQIREMNAGKPISSVVQGMSLSEITHNNEIKIEYKDRDDIRTLPYQVLFEQTRSSTIGSKFNVREDHHSLDHKARY